MEDEELLSALDAPDTEIDRLDPVPETATLQNGIEVRILDLRTRQLFKLLRIVTHGAGQAFIQSNLDFSDDSGVFLQKLVTLVMFSIPDAEQEAIEFLQSMVEPADLVDKDPKQLSKAERDKNIALWTELNQEIWNPEPQDTIELIEVIVRREAKDIQALGKRIGQFLKLAQKTGQLVAGSSQEQNSPASSPASSTSSSTSTGGRTRTSKTSRSDGSGKSSRPSRSGTGRRSAAAAR